MTEYLPFEQIIRGDRRHDGRDARAMTDAVQRELLAMRVSSKIPHLAAHHIGLAKQLCIAGVFFYDLCAVAVHVTGVACEVALRERFLAQLSVPVVFTKAGITRTLECRPSAEELVHLLRGGLRLEGHRKGFRASFRELVRWAVDSGVAKKADEGWWVSAVGMRNLLAHGSETIVPLSAPLGVLRRAVWMLNGMFSDADTSAYDAPLRAAGDEEVAREDEETRRFLDREFGSHE